MVATIALIELVGYVVLLLWGMHMVQSGVVRAFGSNLRIVIGQTLHNRFAAVGAGLAVTVLVQSSTATAMMTASLAADGLVELVPALAVMLGANVGTALIVKLLSFDVSWIVPLLLIAGYVAFRKARRGIPHDLGRVGIGLGLMLLALHQLVSTIEPVETAPALKVLLGALTGEPLLDLALAAILTWAAHSSIAVMLLIASLAAAGVVTLPAAIALVLGANLGGTIPPVLEGPQADPEGRRLPIGNLSIRAVGCVATLPFIHPIAALLLKLDPSAAGSVVDFHILFNLALTLVFVWFLDPVARLLTRVLPTKPKPADMTDPLYLEEAALDTPYLALTNASREALRMADLVDAMLQQFHKTATGGDTQAIKDLVHAGKMLDRLQEAVKAYLTQLGTDSLSSTDVERHSHVLDFAVNLGHAGDIIERSLADAAARKAKRGLAMSPDDASDLTTFVTRVREDLRMAESTFMTEDTRSARKLMERKRQLNAMERATSRRHLARLKVHQPEELEASTIYLTMLRDLRRVNSHISGVAYDVLGLVEQSDQADGSAQEMPVEQEPQSNG
jgi:phosphate:Na+ symporter